jgi:hypothetical protein
MRGSKPERTAGWERGLPCFPFTLREAWEAFRAPPGGPCHTGGVNPRAITSLSLFDFPVSTGILKTAEGIMAEVSLGKVG